MVHLATAVPQQYNMAGLLGLAIVVLAVGAPLGALGQLSVSEHKRCGDTSCEPHQYCRDADQICSQCSTICDTKSHNLQERICESQCQDYLHDLRYQLRTGKELPHDENPGLYAQIQRLQVLSTVSLIISLILACIIIGVAAIWIKKKNLLPFLFKKDKKSLKMHDKARYVGETPTPISTIRLPKDTTINLPPLTDAVRPTGQTPPTEYTHLSTFKNPAPKKPVTPETPSSTTKSLPGIGRVPSEDSTYAYDNPALTPSPTATKANVSA